MLFCQLDNVTHHNLVPSCKVGGSVWERDSTQRNLSYSTSLPPCPPGQLMQVEERGRGSVPWSVYGVYIQASGGALAFLLILALFVLNVGSTAFSNWWLSYWIKQGSGVSGTGGIGWQGRGGQCHFIVLVNSGSELDLRVEKYASKVNGTFWISINPFYIPWALELENVNVTVDLENKLYCLQRCCR